MKLEASNREHQLIVKDIANVNNLKKDKDILEQELTVEKVENACLMKKVEISSTLEKNLEDAETR